MIQPNRGLTPWSLLLAVLMSWGLMACSESDKKSEPSAQTPPPQAETPKQPEAPYEPPPSGLLENGDFAVDNRGVPVGWSFQQHANTSSFTIAVDDGVVKIVRIGTEPWGVLRQSFRRGAVEPLLGKTLEFSAEIAGEFNEEYGEPMEPPGLTVRVRGVRAGSPAMLGVSTLLTASETLDTTSGYLPWRRYTLRFALPDADKVRGVDFDLGILMTMGGEMRVRGASLQVVETNAE